VSAPLEPKRQIPARGRRYLRPEETNTIARAKRAPAGLVEEVRVMHHAWLLDSEIGERLGLTRLLVWHIRQLHHINRHRQP
jgi:hypothetical protein